MIRNRNDPARKGEAVECLLAGDIDGYSNRSLQLQTLRNRFALPVGRATIIAELAWGGLMVESFTTHQAAAMAVLTSGANLRRKEGQFLGGCAFDANPLSAKQLNWLGILLNRHGLPPLADGGVHE